MAISFIDESTGLQYFLATTTQRVKVGDLLIVENLIATPYIGVDRPFPNGIATQNGKSGQEIWWVKIKDALRANNLKLINGRRDELVAYQ